MHTRCDTVPGTVVLSYHHMEYCRVIIILVKTAKNHKCFVLFPHCCWLEVKQWMFNNQQQGQLPDAMLDPMLQQLQDMHKQLLVDGNTWIAAVKEAPTTKQASEMLQQGLQQLYQSFEQGAAEPLLQLITLQKALRSILVIQMHMPTVVLVGAPNIGKLTIVCAISSATPKVNNYPFMMHGVMLGHVSVVWSHEPKDDGKGALLKKLKSS